MQIKKYIFMWKWLCLSIADLQQLFYKFVDNKQNKVECATYNNDSGAAGKTQWIA